MTTSRALLLSLALLLAACGFRPLYGTHSLAEQSGASDQLALVAIDNIPDRPGQQLRNELMDRFYKHGRPASPRYRLHLRALRENLSDLDITKTSDATRRQLRVDTMFVLKDEAGKDLLRRDISAITSFNVLQSQFTTRVSEEDARRGALDDIARQIETQLVLYFSRTP